MSLSSLSVMVFPIGECVILLLGKYIDKHLKEIYNSLKGNYFFERKYGKYKEIMAL